MMNWSSEADARRRRAVMEEDARQRDADFETYSRRVNNLSFREQISVRPYEHRVQDHLERQSTKSISNVLYHQQLSPKCQIQSNRDASIERK